MCKEGLDLESVELLKKREALLHEFYALNWALNWVSNSSSKEAMFISAVIEEAIRCICERLAFIFGEEYPLTKLEPEKVKEKLERLEPKEAEPR